MVDDKEHLFDRDEYQRQIKKEMSKLNSQQFANAGPGGLGPEITTTGLKTNIEPIADQFLGVGFAVQDYGTIGFVSQNIDFDFLGAKYNKFDLNGDVTFGFLNFPLNRAEIFTVDITINTGTPPVIIWPASVKNLPINLPTANGSRYILHMAGYRNDNEEVYHVIGGSTGSILPAGTAENQHLEWDNSGLVWLAVSTSEYGATGPHADSGFLRFANDNIMLSQRNAADTSNLEFKVTTLDEFDFTNSLDSSVVELVVRAQQTPQGDAKFIIRQNPDDGASGDITTFTAPQSILLNVNASVLMTIGPTEVDVQANLDMNLGNIREVTEIQGRDDATPFKIVFDQAEDADTFISDDTSTADRINITAGGVAFWSWINDGTDKIAGITTGSDGILTISDGQLNMLARAVPPDADIANDEMTIYGDTATDPLRLLFKRKTTAGVVSVGTFLYSPLDFDLDMGGNDITVIGSLVLNATSGHDIADTTFPFDEIHARKFLPSSATPTTGRPGLKRTSDEIYIDVPLTTGFFQIREDGGLTAGFLKFENISTTSQLMLGNDVTSLFLGELANDRTELVYNGTDFIINADTNLTGQGIRIKTDIGGGAIDRMFISDVEILFSEPLNMNALAITNTGTITPDVSDTYNLGAGGNRYAQLHVNTIAGAGQLLTLNSSLAIFNIDVGDEFQIQVGAGSVELQVQTDTVIFNAEIIADSTMRFAETTAPTNVADTAFIYSKDVATVTHMFVMDSAGVETDLTTGGGGSTFTDAAFDVHDEVTPAKIFKFNLGGMADGTTTFDINNTIARIYTFPDATGNMAMHNIDNQFSVIQTIITDANNLISISPSGSIEMIGASITPFIDMKNLGADDFDVRIILSGGTGLGFVTGGQGATANALLLDANQDADFENNNIIDVNSIVFNAVVTGFPSITATTTTITIQPNATNTYVFGTAGLDMDGNDLTGIDDINFTTAGVNILHSAGSLNYEVPSGETHLFEVASLSQLTITLTTVDVHNNDIINTGDIIMGSADFIRATSTTEIGYHVTNSTVAVGSEGTIELPATTTSSANKAAADAKYGAIFGAIGIHDSGSALSIFVRQNNGNWAQTLMGYNALV